MAEDCVGIVAAMIAATGLSRAQFVRRMDEYAEQYGDDPAGGLLFAAEMARLSSAREGN